MEFVTSVRSSAVFRLELSCLWPFLALSGSPWLPLAHTGFNWLWGSSISLIKSLLGTQGPCSACSYCAIALINICLTPFLSLGCFVLLLPSSRQCTSRRSEEIGLSSKDALRLKLPPRNQHQFPQLKTSRCNIFL